MSIVWNKINLVAGNGDDAELGVVGGFFVSDELKNGEGYDLWDDLVNNPPPPANPDIEKHWVTCRVSVELSVLPDISQRGFPFRRNYGSITIGAGPTYIIEQQWINYPRQFIGYYNPMIGRVMPTGSVLIDDSSDTLYTRQSAGVSSLQTGSPRLLMPGSNFFIAGHPAMRLRVRGSLLASPAIRSVFGTEFSRVVSHQHWM